MEALLGGEYRQGGIGQLCWQRGDRVEWSALGVLLDVAYNGEWVSSPGTGDRGASVVFWTMQDHCWDPSDAMLRRLGLSLKKALHISRMDHFGWSFQDIAHYIDERV